jgi:hypothetical protein
MRLKTFAIPWQVRIHLFLFFASILWILVPAINKSPSQLVTQQSIVAASEFLYLVDTEEYSRSWDVTSASLKSMLSEEAWNERITELRSFLGPVVERIQHDITYTDSAGDVPDGEYVVMTFISRFELRERVVEKLTLMLGDDDYWKVVGYFLS